MKLGRNRREPPDINLTPLIDVVFLLLIFFMVSTTFQKESQISLELPEANAPPQEAPPESIEVSIDAKGAFFVNGRSLVNAQAATLKRALTDALGDATDVPVLISADAATPHQAVVTVMDTARQLGLFRFSFPVQRSSE